MPRLRTLLLLAAAALSNGCRAFTTTDLGPTQVAQALFDALANSRWDSATVLADSEWLVSYHGQQVQVLESVAMARAGIHLAPQGVTIPGDTFTARFIRNFGSRPLKGLPGVATFADLLALSPRQFLAHCFEGIAELEGRRTSAARTSRQVLGQTREDSDWAYVVYRRVGPTPDDTDPEPWVLPLVKRHDRWRYVLPRHFDSPPCALLGALDAPRHK